MLSRPVMEKEAQKLLGAEWVQACICLLAALHLLMHKAWSLSGLGTGRGPGNRNCHLWMSTSYQHMKKTSGGSSLHGERAPKQRGVRQERMDMPVEQDQLSQLKGSLAGYHPCPPRVDCLKSWHSCHHSPFLCP